MFCDSVFHIYFHLILIPVPPGILNSIIFEVEAVALMICSFFPDAAEIVKSACFSLVPDKISSLQFNFGSPIVLKTAVL